MNHSYLDKLTDIAKKVNILRKFPSIKTIGLYSMDVTVENVKIVYRHANLKFINESEYYLHNQYDSYKPFLEIMYNIKTLQIHYTLTKANYFLEVLEIIKSNELVLDELHIVNCFDRDLSDALILFTNYKVLKFTHSIDFNDLVVHCRENNIIYIKE